MLATHLGFYNTASSRTHVRFQFSTHAAAGGNVAPSSAFEAADLRIYKAADGAAFSATQRSSAAGITMTSPFDSLTGVHDVDIDLTDNTDAGFYAAGGFYSVVLAPDETVDSQTLTGVVLAYFEIGLHTVNVTQVAGTTQTAGDIIADTNDIQTRLPAALVSGRMDSSVGAMAANVLTATAINADAITAAKLAADVTTELQSGLATAAALDAVDNFLDTEVAAILAAVDTEVAAIKAVTDLLPDAGALTSLATQASVNTIDDFLDTEIAAIKAKTDSLTFTVAGVVDANVQRINDVTITGDGQTGTEFGV